MSDKRIDDNLEIISTILVDVITLIRSIFLVGISLFLSTTIFKVKLPIETSSLDSVVSDVLFLWGAIYLISSIFIVPLWWILTRDEGKYWRVDLALIARLILAVATIISTLSFFNPLIKVCGIIGLILSLIFYVFTGYWRIIPGEALIREGLQVVSRRQVLGGGNGSLN